jgi:hypothetical protein
MPYVNPSGQLLLNSAGQLALSCCCQYTVCPCRGHELQVSVSVAEYAYCWRTCGTPAQNVSGAGAPPGVCPQCLGGYDWTYTDGVHTWHFGVTLTSYCNDLGNCHDRNHLDVWLWGKCVGYSEVLTWGKVWTCQTLTCPGTLVLSGNLADACGTSHLATVTLTWS